MDEENFKGLTREQLLEKIDQLQSCLKELDSSTERRERERLCQRVKECSFESLRTAVAFIDLKGTLTYVNKAFLKLFVCWSAPEVLGRRIDEFMKEPANVGVIIETLKRIGSWSGELLMRRKDLSPFSVQMSAQLVKGPDANPLGMMATFIDITERKYMVEKIVASEHKYRDLFENASDAIFILDADLKYTDVNRRAELLTGYSRDELMSKSVLDFIPPEQSPTSEEEFQKLRSEGGYENFVGKMRRKDGSWVDVEVSSSAIVEGGKVIGSRDIVRDITKRLKIERALRMRDHALRHSMNGVALTDVEGRLIFANEAILSMWGYEKEEEILGRHPAEFAESPLEVMEILRGIFEKGSGTGEVVARRKDGTLFDVLFASTLIKGDDGALIGIMSSFLDVTERKKTERELQMKDEAIRKSINGISFTDAEGRIVYANDEFLRMWGYKDESEVLGRTPHDFAATPEDAERVLKEIEENGFFLGEVPAKKKDGSLFDLHFSATLLRDERGAPITLMASFIDITARKNAERELQQAHEMLEQRVQERTAELHELNLDLSHEVAVRMEAEKKARQSETLFRTAFQTIPDAMAISSIQDGVYVDVNEAFTVLTGYERDEVIGKSALKLQLWVNSVDQDILITRMKASGVVKDFEMQIRRKDGSLLTGLMSGKFIEIERVPHLLTVMKDITGRKESEEKLRESTMLLEQKNEELQLALGRAQAADRAKGEFLANMSHELRTPIHGILGHSELLLDGPLDDQQREHAELSVRSTRALLAVIDEVLEYSRLAKGKVRLEDRPFSPKRVLEDIRDLFVIPAKDKGLDLSIHLDPEVPEELYGDPVRLKQVLMGLAGNAVKFTEKGTASIRAEKESSADGEKMLVFHVTDTGIGVCEEVKEIIFEAFSQADGSLSRSHEGLGLGLTIASELVRLMGGMIGITSKAGEGSDVFFSVPLQHASALEAPDKTLLSEKNKGAGSARRILLVDDNPLDRKVTMRMLQKAGHSVTDVQNAREALSALEKEEFDLVLLDILMPEMDGFEVARAIRESEKGRGKHIPILALTALVQEGSRQKCLDAGMDGYMAKPPSKKDLLAAVANMG